METPDFALLHPGYGGSVMCDAIVAAGGSNDSCRLDGIELSIVEMAGRAGMSI